MAHLPAEELSFQPPNWTAAMGILVGLINRCGSKLAKDISMMEAGYCIDAPEMLPAGGCYNEAVDVGDGREELVNLQGQSFFLRG